MHEIKHDGFRIMAYRDGRHVRPITRNGHDFADRFPLAADAVEALPVRSCVIDSEAIVCDHSGLGCFRPNPRVRHNARAVLCAFDLLAVNGEDLRGEPIENSKRRLTASCVCRARASR